MSSYAKFFWRLFWTASVLFGCPFGLIMGLEVPLIRHASILTAVRLGVVTGIMGGVYFGAAMALMLGAMHCCGIRRRGFKLTGQNLAVVHRRAMSLRLPYEQAFDRCREAVYQLRRTIPQQEDRFAGMLVARSWTKDSCGERIICIIQPEPDGTTRVLFSSRPILRTMMLDQGKNLENVERIRSYLAQHEA